MPRNAGSDYVTALGSGILYPALFVTITFASGPVYMWSGWESTVFLGDTWTGVGSLLDVSTIEDGSSVQARGISVTLGGIDPTLLPAALNEFQVGLPATIYLGLINGDGQAQIDTPVVAWSGRTDQPTITSGPDTASISIALESLLMDMNTPVPYRYTNQDQQLFAPGDLGMQWVNSIQSIPIYWGQNTNSDGNP